MTAFLSLLAAFSWGTGDFFGGVASRHGRATAVALASQLLGIIAVLVLAPLIGGTPGAADMAWGAVAGISGGVGLLFLYRGMAVADMGLVVPVAAIGTGVFPLLFGIATGDRLGGLEVFGLVLALAAIWMVSYETGLRAVHPARGLLFGLGAGAGFGGLLVGLSRIGDAAGIWPLTGTRLMGAVVVGAIALATRQPLRPLRRSWPALLPAGALGVVGNALFIFATQDGPLAVAAVIGSLFPAVTVSLAKIVLHEVLTAVRIAGLVTAIVAVALISLG